MRARGGGVLSASALVAVGTSVLLAVVVGLGISELGTRDSSGLSSSMRAEAASVIVPGSEGRPTPAVTHSPHPARPHRALTYPWRPSVAQPSTSATSSTASRTATTSRTLRSTTQTSSSPSPSPSPTPTPTHGNGKAKGAGSGHHKPSKR